MPTLPPSFMLYTKLGRDVFGVVTVLDSELIKLAPQTDGGDFDHCHEVG